MQNDTNNSLKIFHALVAKDATDISFQIENSSLSNNFFALDQNIILGDKLFLPQINDMSQSRFGVDLAACYYLFHDKEIHEKFSAAAKSQQYLFDLFEKIRVIASVKNIYKGVVQNILQQFEKDVESLENSEREHVAIAFLESIFEREKEKNIDKKILSRFKKLAKKIDNQEQFALETLDLLKFLDQQENQEKSAQSQQKSQQQKQQENLENATQNSENVQQPSELNAEEKNQQEQENSSQKMQEQNFSLQLKSDQSQQEMQEKIEFKNNYKIFTNKFDEIILPQKLLSKTELENLRHGLDLRMAKLKGVSKKLELQLKRKLLAKKNFYIEKNQNDGILDRKKFAQIIANPHFKNYFVTQKKYQYQDTIVTILLDNSGSMRGQPILMSAIACEIIAKIFEKFAIKTEILGFTTVDWKGGKSRKMWEGQGSPQNSGRVSDLRHIIYKSANQSFKKAKINLGLMLKEGILKENIDGEALLWARGRLMQLGEKRKILAVISDGTPVDDATNSTNDSDILCDHLYHIISRIEKQKMIEIFGIGIGHNVEKFYHNSITIKNPQELGNVMIEKITRLI